MLVNQYNKQSFTGEYKTSNYLKNKLNNVKELETLADVSGVDSLKTNLTNDSHFLPRDDAYVTLATKRYNSHVYHGVDCVLLDKKTDNKTLSKKVFESAQRSLGKLYGNIATDTKNKVFGTPTSDSKPQNTFSKMISKIKNIFKK